MSDIAIVLANTGLQFFYFSFHLSPLTISPTSAALRSQIDTLYRAPTRTIPLTQMRDSKYSQTPPRTPPPVPFYSSTLFRAMWQRRAPLPMSPPRGSGRDWLPSEYHSAMRTVHLAMSWREEEYGPDCSLGLDTTVQGLPTMISTRWNRLLYANPV